MRKEKGELLVSKVWREALEKVLRLKSWKLYALAHSLDARPNAVQHTTIDYRGVSCFLSAGFGPSHFLV